MLARLTIALLVLLAGNAPSTADAHGLLLAPKATYPIWGGNVCSTIKSDALPFDFVYGKITYQEAFDTAIVKSGSSLKDFILKHQDMSGATVAGSTPECGYSDPNGEPQPLPDKINYNGGIIHQGPCEAYCDDELVTKHSFNCREMYAGGLIPYDAAKCQGKKRFTFYLLGMDSLNLLSGAPYQVYINCVPLQGAASGGSGNSTTTSPRPRTTAPAATPAPTAAAEATRTPALTPSAPAPAPSTTKPSSNCVRRVRN